MTRPPSEGNSMYSDAVAVLTWYAFQKQRSDTGTRLVPESETTTGSGQMRIRCPRCGWEPRKEDRWSCLCGHTWNTFDTGGVCPSCKRVWTHTQCFRCQQWPRHDAWYVWDGRPEED